MKKVKYIYIPILETSSTYFTNSHHTIGVNFRGCCGYTNNQPGQYHVGFTADMKLVLDLLKDHNEKFGHHNKPIYMSGFSLGANVVVKTLGELGVDAKVRLRCEGMKISSSYIPFIYF